jgi:undecaprenyl diphosphate synthase
MTSPNDTSIPHHIAIIPDGNRRWAKQRGLETKEGHKTGYDVLKRTADEAFARGVNYVTGYVFSTENWSRAADEVNYLMGLVAWVVREEANEYHEKGICIKILGSKEGLDPKLVKGLADIQELTRHNTNGTLSLCFNYGGRSDLIAAMRQLAQDKVAPEDIDEAAIAGTLATTGMPNPDLVIRTSGERRLSNYLVWESAYSELYFTDILWPDFDATELDRALADYANRKRNFGK